MQANPLVSAEVNISTAPIPLTHVSNSSNGSSRNGSKNPPALSRTPIPRTNQNKMECLSQYVIEHGLDPKKFSKTEKKRWATLTLCGDLETDMRFNCGAIERKEDPRKYQISNRSRKVDW